MTGFMTVDDMTLFDVITRIAPQIANATHIHAMWLEGSWATGMNNHDSDIDVWLDVDDGTFTESIELFHAALATVGEIDWERSRGVYSRDPHLQKHTYHLAGFPESQCIELDLQEHSRGFVFVRDEHAIEVIFDKDQTIVWDG